jgi:hypothetical protein
MEMKVMKLNEMSVLAGNASLILQYVRLSKWPVKSRRNEF